MAFLGGCASHALADMVPHHDYQETKWGVLDVAAAVAIGFLLVSLGYGVSVLAGGIGGMSPDIEVVWAHFHPEDYLPPNPRRRLLFPSHSGLLPHGKLDFPWGFILQLGMVAALLTLFVKEAS